MKRPLLLLILLYLTGYFSYISAQCVCTNCPQVMPDNFTGDFIINVSGAVNNDLGSSSQGVCGVYLSFDHEYVGDLQITLTSPSGQSVTLVGPIGLFGETDGSIWNVLFVPCGTPPNPDPGQSGIWNNDGFTSNANYSGSYHPNQGCLEDFNAGPVDGTWVLTVTDGQALDMGNFQDYSIIFCDDNGIDCVSCEPGGGTLPTPPISEACEGDPQLNLNLDPSYSFGEEPDPNDYDYLFVISENDVIQDYVLSPNLVSYPPGEYTICGLSYYIPDEPDIPPANGSYTLSLLQSQLNSTTPPICGELSDNCVTIEIYEIPEPEEVQATICAGDSYLAGGQLFSSTGSYIINLTNANGCDSTVLLDLEVLPPAINDVIATICEGEMFEIGGAEFSMPGNFQVYLPGQGAMGCDSTINLTLEVLNPMAEIALPDTLDCLSTATPLDGAGSVVGSNGEFAWEHLDGNGIIGPENQPVALAGEPGTYMLTLSESNFSGMITCVDTASVEVLADYHTAVADAGPDLVFDCLTDSLELSGSGADSLGNPLAFSWTGPHGFSSDSLHPFVTQEGEYIFSVENLNNGCVATDTAEVSLDNIVADYTAFGDTLTCINTLAQLSVNYDPVDSLSFQWTGPQGFQSAAPDTSTLLTGVYQLIVTAPNGCQDTSLVEVLEDGDFPDISVSADTLTCARDTVTLYGNSTTAQVAYFWTGPGGFVSAEQEPQTTQPGAYQLSVAATNGCVSSLVLDLPVDTLPPQLQTFGDTLSCSDSTAVAAASSNTPGVSFAWTLGGNILTDSFITVSNAGSYPLTVTGPNGCVVDTTVEIFADLGLPNLFILQPDTLTCATDTVSLDASGSQSGTDIVYAWTNLNDSLLSSQANTNTTLPGTFVFTAINTDNGCVAADTVTVAQDISLPTATAFTTDTLSCVVGTALLNGSASAGAAPLNFAWYNPDDLYLDGANMVLGDIPGDYLLVVTQPNGCSDSTFVNVAIDTLFPLAQATPLDTVTCRLPLAEVSIQGSSVGSPFSYAWTNPAGNLLGTGDSILLASGGVYLLSVQNNNNGCVSTDTFNLQENTTFPIAQLNGMDTLDCATTAFLLNGSPSSAAGPLDYYWENFTGDTLATAANLNVNNPGAYLLWVEDQQNGCRDSLLAEVLQDTLAPLSEAGLADTLTCTQLTALLGAAPTSQGTEFSYTWTDAAGLPQGTQDTLSVNGPGWYFLEVLDNSNACSSLDSVLIFQDVTPPVAEAGPTDTLTCDLTSVPLDASASTGLQLSYEWSNETGTVISNTASAQAAAAGVYTLLVTQGSNGCTATDQVEIVPDDDLPEAQIALPQELNCTQTSVLLDASASTQGPQITYQWTLNGQVVGSADQLTVSTPGLYELVVVNIQNSCEASTSVDVGQDTIAPIVEAGPDDMLNCYQPALSLIATVNTGGLQSAWTDTGGNLLSDSLSLPVIQPGTYTFTATNPANGCSATDQLEISLDTLPPLAAIAAPQILNCDLTTQELDGSASSTGAEFTYTWTDSLGQELGNDLLVQVQQPGDYTLTVFDQENGCTSSATIEVMQDTALPVPVIATPEVLTCGQTTITLDATASYNGSNLQFGWVWENSSVGTGATVSVTEPGEYALTLFNPDNQCQSEATVTVEQDTVFPIVEAGPDGLLTCDQEDWLLQGLASGANGAFQYLWTDTTGNLQSQMPSWTADEPGLYTLTVTDTLNACSTTDEVLLSENIDPPVAQAAANGTLTCDQLNVTLSSAGSSAGAGISYLWQDELQNEIDTTPEVSTALPGLFTLTVTDQSNGCISTAAVSVSQDTASPQIVLSPDGALQLTCEEPNLTLDASASMPVGELLFAWTAGGQPLSSDNVLTLNAPGFYTLQLTDTTNGCQVSTTVEVGADDDLPLVVLATPDTITCLQDTVLLDATGTSSGPDFAYQWSGPGLLFTADPLQAQAFAAGVYTLEVTDNSNGCLNTGTVTVVADQIFPAVVAMVDGELDCETPTVTLSGEGSAAGSEFQYLWETMDGNIVGNSQLLEVSATEPGIYSFTISNTLNGCSATAEVEVTQYTDLPTGAFILVQDPDCHGDTNGGIQLESVQGGTAPFSYYLNDEGPFPAPSFAGLAPGEYLLTVEDTRGCSWDTLLLIEEPPLLTVNLGDDQLINLGESINLYAEISYPVDTLIWFSPEDFPCTTAAGCVDTPLITTLYQVQVVDQNGCTASDEVRVRVRKPRRVAIANVFSPNEDGFNDFLQMSVGEDVEQVESFLIFNRWGEKVFEMREFLPSGNPSADGWDGTFRGEKLNPGVFVYFAEVRFKDGSVEVFEGDVTLLR